MWMRMIFVRKTCNEFTSNGGRDAADILLPFPKISASVHGILTDAVDFSCKKIDLSILPRIGRNDGSDYKNDSNNNRNGLIIY